MSYVSLIYRDLVGPKSEDGRVHDVEGGLREGVREAVH